MGASRKATPRKKTTLTTNGAKFNATSCKTLRRARMRDAMLVMDQNNFKQRGSSEAMV
jgi:hypothetical protein